MAKKRGVIPFRLAIIAPCFNEGKTVARFVETVGLELDKLHSTYQSMEAFVVLIDDGSSDDTWEEIQKLRSSFRKATIAGLRFSRNFGHQSAICAGLDYVYQEILRSDDDVIVVMDSDSQHPPQLIPKLIEARFEGYHHVQMVRQNEAGGFAKRFISPLFYKCFRLLSGLQLPNGAADFRAFSGFFLKQYLRFNESIRFNRGLFHWMGFKTKYIPYKAADRIGGESSYTIWKMTKFAFHGITYFSSKPLILSTAVTTLIGFLFCFGYGTYEFICALNGASYVPGWLTIIFVVSLWGSLLSLGQALMAVYIARIFEEAKQRPIYIVESYSDDAAEAKAAAKLTGYGIQNLKSAKASRKNSA